MSFTFRRSRVLDKLRSGKPVSCVQLNLGTSRVAEIAACSGFDCIWVDMEHTPSTLEQVEHQINAAKMLDVDTMVRVRRGSYSDMICPLEADAAGIMIPHVKTADDARMIVRNTRFHPGGLRPIDGGNADGRFCMLDLPTYTKMANEHRFVVCQIEDVEAMDELDDIAAVEGLDMLFFGRNDFAHSLGVPGQFDRKEVIEARRSVAEAARRHGKFAATAAPMGDVSELLDMGYLFIKVIADVVCLVKGFEQAVAGLKERGIG
jgi:4-hydroxy-2-oxoheptanedioate aldolase